jgi:hypothetical protein
MTIPDDLRTAIPEAERNLASNPHGALELCCRQRIWTALGLRQAFGPGHRRRTNLAVFCVRKILPAWEKLRPADDMPHRLLQAVDEYLAGTLDRKAAVRLWGKGQTHGDNVSYAGWKAKDRSMQRVCLVCCAAVATLAKATGDDKPPRFDVDVSLTDRMLDAYQWDTSYYVSLFLGGGHPGKPGEDIGRRREFWQWYIHEAAPMAWQSEREDE